MNDELMKQKNEKLIKSLLETVNEEDRPTFRLFLDSIAQHGDLSHVFADPKSIQTRCNDCGHVDNFCWCQGKKVNHQQKSQKPTNKKVEYTFQEMLYECESDPRKTFINIHTEKEFKYEPNECTFTVELATGVYAPIKITSSLLNTRFKLIETNKTTMADASFVKCTAGQAIDGIKLGKIAKFSVIIQDKKCNGKAVIKNQDLLVTTDDKTINEPDNIVFISALLTGEWFIEKNSQ